MKTLALLSAVMLVTLVGCAGSPTMSYQEKNAAYEQFISSNKLESLKRINTFRLYSWSSLTNDYLILSTSPRKKYLIEVMGYCPDLGFAQTIRINQSMSSQLSARFDSISVIDGDAGSAQIKCHIKTIHKIDKAQAKQINAIGEPVDENEPKEENKATSAS